MLEETVKRATQNLNAQKRLYGELVKYGKENHLPEEILDSQIKVSQMFEADYDNHAHSEEAYYKRAIQRVTGIDAKGIESRYEQRAVDNLLRGIFGAKIMLEQNDFKIVYAPTYELAEQYKNESNEDIVATVEAEYGDKVVEGSLITMAHHGSRSDNPAPCNWTNIPQMKDGTIIVSHLDLDTVGGIMALSGTKMKDDEFWQAAEYIDLNGPHHIHELSEDIQDKLNAIYSYSEKLDRLPREVTDITDTVRDYAVKISIALDDRHPFHDEMIQNGKEWVKETDNKIESCLVYENENVRVFDSDGPFTAASYYSPNQDAVIPATVSLNKFGAITIAFEQDIGLNAGEIAKEIFGEEAGGHAGIGGSPRGVTQTKEKLKEVAEIIDKKVEMVKDKVKTTSLNESLSEIIDKQLEQKLSNVWDRIKKNLDNKDFVPKQPDLDLELEPEPEMPIPEGAEL